MAVSDSESGIFPPGKEMKGLCGGVHRYAVSTSQGKNPFSKGN